MELKKTTLYKKHVELGAKMVPFAGYEMPLSYTSLIEEHKAVRNKVGMFDVSHMGEFMVKGPQALSLVQKLTSNDVTKLSNGKAQYSCFPNKTGGIIDDLLVYQIKEEVYMLVVNASNITKDWDWIIENNTENAIVENHSDNTSLFALQGPLALNVLQRLTKEQLSEIPYYSFRIGEVAGISDVIISATGYTGSGGFELYVSNQNATALWDAIISAGTEENIIPVGLGARDTLRLEMGYCLYGNDIDDTTSPLEAGLSWITKLDKPFINADYLAKEKQQGVQKKLVGFEMIERGIPRKDYEICNAAGEVIGKVTSGGQSPNLSKGIGMGYVSSSFSKIDTEIYIQIRKKKIKAVIKKLPFIKI